MRRPAEANRHRRRGAIARRGLVLALALAALLAPASRAAAPEEAVLARLRAAQRIALAVRADFLYTPSGSAEARPIPGRSLPFAWTAAQLLRAAGVRPVAAGAEADGRIVIVAEGRAIGRRYFADARGYVYPGAVLEGAIVVEVPGLAPWRLRFGATLQPPVSLAIDRGYADPANAPFEAAYVAPTSFVARFAALVGRVWGAPALIEALGLSDPWLRRYAAKALGDLGDGRAVTALVAALDDPDPLLRREAAWALGRIGDARAAPALRAALDDADADVRWFARWALERLGG